MFEYNIKSYIKTLEKPHQPINIDIVLEGGGFNGAYEYGVLLLLKEMESQDFIKVHRISGASVGSILGLCYLSDNMHFYTEHYDIIRESFKETGTLAKCKDILKERIYNFTDELFESFQHKKLYITYFDVNKKQQMVQESFSNKEDLLRGIIKSCYIPFIFDNNLAYKIENEAYMDGGQPFIFKERSNDDRRILYITINQLGRLRNMFSLKGEKNQNTRILEGLLDAMQFFTYNKRTTICSYVNYWNLSDFIVIRCKQAGLLITAYFVYCILYLHSCIPEIIKSTVIYQLIKILLITMYKDIILFYCF